MKTPVHYVLAACLIFSQCSGRPETTNISTDPSTIINNMSDSSGTKNNHEFYSRTDTSKLDLPDSTWKRILPDELYEVARHAATERAFTGKYWDYEGLGTYYCAACGNALFKSDSKFSSSCGWPSFYESIRPASVRYKKDNSYGMIRVEVLCGRCDAHLGHIFDDGPPPTGKRFCMNSVSLDFEPDRK